MRGIWSRFSVCLFVVLCVSAATAAPTEIKILLNTDNNQTTGCQVATARGLFEGVEQIFTTTFDTVGSGLQVTGITRQVCVDPSTNSFGSAETIDAGGWAVRDSGAGNLLLETYAPLKAIGSGPFTLAFTAQSASTSDVILQQRDGSAILYPPATPGPRSRPVGGALRLIVLDGAGTDWNGLSPLVGEGAGIGSPALSLGGIYVFEGLNDLFFRFDILSNPAAPHANPDTYSVVRGGTLNVAPPGVLANDIDPSSRPLTAILVIRPQHGVLNLNANGGFNYTNDGSNAPQDSFVYEASDGVSLSNAAQVTLNIINGTPPVITSAASTMFTDGIAGSFQITTSGSPTPTLSESGSLPAGVTFTANGDGTGTLAGTPASGTSGGYKITFTASNTAGTATQLFTLRVNGSPTITSANATTFVTGAPGSFTVTTSGLPLPSLSKTGTLPAGVTFTDNGNGTATLSGTPNAGTGGTYPLIITASNGLAPDATQNFTLTVDQSPAITSANATAFTVGQAGTFTVTTTGVPTGASMAISESGSLPPGVTFVDNHNGTATLSGTPNPNTGATYPITITANNGVAPNATQNFTLVVNQAPAITSANQAIFKPGVAHSFTVTTTGFPTGASMLISESGSLPTGLTFTDNHDGTATLAGTASGSGDFPIVITASNGIAPDATQDFTIHLNAPPSFTSANNTTFKVGTAGTFAITTSGIPTVTTISMTGTLPTGVNFIDNGNGTATLAGTPGPGTAGTYSLIFTATNGVPPDATQNFTLTVQQAPAITSANNTTFKLGTAGTFTVTTTGFPTGASMVISESGTLPTGITFTDNHNGTATIGGTATQTGTFPLTITANNGVTPPATQSFTLTVQQAPAITSGNATTFQTGQAGTFTVTTTGFPIAAISETGALPSGVTFVDNGNGTATLAGTPNAGTGGSYPITITANNGVTPNATQSFTLTVNQAPAITSANNTTFNVGTAGTFTVTTTGFPTGASMVISESGTLPTGITFTDNHNGTATIGGTATQTGTFPITITANNGVTPNATQSYTITVTCPTITVIRTGGGSFPAAPYNVPYTGQSFTASGSNGTPYTITVTGGTFPPGLSLSTAGVISGTPNTTGVFAFTVTATDSFSCTGMLATSITVVPNLTAKSYTDVGNTQLVGGVAAPTTPSVIVVPVSFGDQSDTTIIYAITVQPAHGALTIFNNNGTFLYTPNVGNTIMDAFTYTGTSHGAMATQTATINFNGMVWYVTAGGAAGDGRSQNPFDSLASAGSPTSAPGDFIYISKETSGTTPGNLTLQTNQHLIGAGATLNVPTTSPVLTVLGSAGNSPTLTGTVTLAGGVDVQGFDMNTGSLTAITGSSVAGISVTVRNVTTTTGRAVNIAGAGNSGVMSFTSINAGTSTNGPASGIALANYNGSFTVIGDGSNTANGSGGTIQKTSGNAISLTNVAGASASVSLSSMLIETSSADGINGTGVKNFSLLGCQVLNNGSALANKGVHLFDSTGTATFTNDTVTASSGDNVGIDTTTSSTAVLDTLTVAGGSYSNAGNIGILIQLKHASTLKNGSITGATFSGNAAYPIDAVEDSDATFTSTLGDSVTGTGALTISGCTFTNNNGIGVSFASGGGNGNGNMYARFINNTLTGTHSHAINVVSGATSTGGTQKMLIDSNVIGNAGVAGSGSGIGEGIVVTQQGNSTQTVTITNNTIRQIPNGRGIDVEALGPVAVGQNPTTYPSNYLISVNDVNPQDTSGMPLYAIYVGADDQGSATLVHAEIHGNTVPSTSACDTSCTPSTGMIWFEQVTAPSTGTLFNFNGSGADVSSEIANTNTGTAAKTCSPNTGLSLTSTPVNTVP